MTTSIIYPGSLPPTSQDPQHPSLDSLVDVWAAAVRRHDDLDEVVKSMWRWAT